MSSSNSSTAMVSSCFYLATHPSSQRALYTEVYPLMRSGEFDIRTQLPVLDSVIWESLRLQPSMPSGVQRKTPSSGLVIGDTFIPGHTICRVPNFALNRDKRYFVHSNDFIPERWTTQKELIINSKGFIPFGAGRYHCVASRLGLMKIRAVLAHLVLNFEFALSDQTDKTRWEMSGKENFLMVFGSLHLCFQKRGHSS